MTLTHSALLRFRPESSFYTNFFTNELDSFEFVMKAMLTKTIPNRSMKSVSNLIEITQNIDISKKHCSAVGGILLSIRAYII